MKKRILFVGEHPYGVSGNSHMIRELLNQVNYEMFDVAVFAATSKKELVDIFSTLPYQVIEAGGNPIDEFGEQRLVQTVRGLRFDAVMFVGLDIWRYYRVFSELVELKKKLGFIWGAIFPYDLHTLRRDWLQWVAPIDFPCVYSQYGYTMLKDSIRSLRYFRPPLHEAPKFVAYSKKKKLETRKKIFHIIDEDVFIFGFFGNNQFRKDPQRLIHTFFQLKQDIPNIALYMHTEIGKGVYNLEQYIEDQGGKTGDILVKKQNIPYSTIAMVDAYNAVDCLVNTSLQEGLSWTILEAQLCGIPIIASDNTAQTELLEGGAGLSISSTDLSFVPTTTEKGISFVETKACNISVLKSCMELIVKDASLREQLVERGLKKANEWLQGVNDINELLKEVVSYELPAIVPEPKKDAILFAQHSAAGDVLMTTRCFRGLRDRHPNIPLIYMTMPRYRDIVEGNKYVDEIVDWNEGELNKYRFVYNPHGTRILPGHWGRNCNSILSDFYWKILDVEPNDFSIELKPPCEEITLQIEDIVFYGKRAICVVHTTGGDSHFRTYKYMGDVCEAIKGKYVTVQLGGKGDYGANAEIDLRGKLGFRESAWVTSRAKAAVTVDSFMSHLAGALGVSQVCLFGSGNYVVCQPNQTQGFLLCLIPDYVRDCKGLGPCSANVRDCPAPCTGKHDPKDIIRAIERIEEMEKGVTGNA